jgi:hypothetical protein
MTDARLVFKTRSVRVGGVVEMVVWKVPKPVPPSEHAFKYRLVYVKNGQRVVGYDNERGKGDHKHLGEVETAYRFLDVETLMADFLRDVEAFE